MYFNPSILILVLLSTTTTTINMVKGETTHEQMLHSLEMLLLSPTGASPQGNERARQSRVASEEQADLPSLARSHTDDPIRAHMMRVPKLVQMMNTFNFTDFIHLNTDSLRSGFDPKIGPSNTEPLWERSLRRLEKFVAATYDLKKISLDVTALFDANVKIMEDMVLHTNTNFVGFYN